MISNFANGMLAMMLTKFMMNDVPHRLLFNCNRIGWAEAAWEQLLTFLRSKGFDVVTFVELAKSVKKSEEFKKALSGYFLINAGKAPYYVVEDAFNILKAEFMESIGRYEDFFPTREATVENLEKDLPGIKTVYELFSVAPTRLDMLIAIDAVMHLAHVSEAYIGGEMFRTTSSEFRVMIVEVLDLFGEYFTRI